MGAPCEYFNFSHAIPFLTNRFQTKSLEEYFFEILQHRTTPNGVFGTKLARRHFQFLQLVEFDHPIKTDKWIFSDRRNKYEQAVSLYIANQTDAWSSLMESRKEPVYQFERILRCYRNCINEQRFWNEFFARNAIKPIRAEYEDLIRDLDGTVSNIFNEFRIPKAPKADPAVPKYEKQGSSRNLEWAERFCTELAERF